jgi:hypothetical protein
MALDILENTLLEGPSEEVQLPHGCQKGFMAWNLERDPFTPAKGVKEFLTVGLELVLVVHIHDKFLAIQNVGSAVGFGEVCHKPVNQSEADLARAFQKLNNFRKIGAIGVKALKT